MGGPLPGCNRPVTDPAPRPQPADPVDYALAPSVRARLLGTGLVAIGVVVSLGMVIAWLTDLPSAIVTGLVVLALVGVLTLGLLVGVRHWVLRLDETGYQVRALRTAEARSARWTDVLDLQTRTMSGARCVVLRLRDGRTTALPVDVIEGDPAALTETLMAHLDRGHGYRRLR